MSFQEVLTGDPAPGIRVARFLKGDPVTSFERGSVYVLEFWATWCGPCLESMPHLTALQRTYPDVTILGVAVLEKNPDALAPFVAERSADMGYTVAEDSPFEHEGSGGWMHVHWCQAAYLPGIPAAFIVDRKGRIAWIGQPMEIDDVLAAVVDGTWDIEAKAKAYRDLLTENMTRESTALNAALARARKAGDAEAALRACDEAFALHPDLEPWMCLEKIPLLAIVNKAALPAYADRLVGMLDGQDAETCRAVGMSLYATGGGAAIDRSLALVARKFLTRADKLILAVDEPRPFSVAVTKVGLGEILLALGEIKEALVTAQAAREWIMKIDAPFIVERIDALVARCHGAAGTVTPPAPTMVCDGDVCRIV